MPGSGQSLGEGTIMGTSREGHDFSRAVLLAREWGFSPCGLSQLSRTCYPQIWVFV
jgi:hypothetical protein